MKKRFLALALSMSMALLACGGQKAATETSGAGANVAGTNAESSVAEDKATEEAKAEGSADFDALVAEAKGQTVNFYGWGGDDRLNQWLDGYYAEYLKKNYDITLNRVPMGIEDILAQLSAEKEAGAKESDIDMIWINGENFKTAKESDFLYGPFTQNLPNFNNLVSQEDPETNKDFAYPIEGYEAPYGKAQMVFYGDKSKGDFPKSTEELLAYAKEHPGQITYPALPDFTGSAFVRNVIYDIVGVEPFQTVKEDKEAVRELVKPAMDYLKELNPYLWKEGKTYPEKEPTMRNMVADGELIMGMTYSAYLVSNSIADGSFSNNMQTFIWDKGTIGNTNYIAISKNAKHNAAAQVAINAMLSEDVQLNRYETLKTIPVLDNSKLFKEVQESFAKVDLGEGVLEQSVLLDKRLPEMPAGLVPIIEEIWQEEVAGK